MALTGGCLCGAVRFAVTGDCGASVNCHCQTCRRWQGAPFATNTPVALEDLEIAGAEGVREFESSPGKFRCFCGTCGSPVWVRVAADPGTRRLRMGSFDSDPGVRPLAHIWLDHAVAWVHTDDGLPRFDRFPPGVDRSKVGAPQDSES